MSPLSRDARVCFAQLSDRSSDNSAGWATVTNRTATSITFTVRKFGSSYNQTGEAASAVRYISVEVMGQAAP